MAFATRQDLIKRLHELNELYDKGILKEYESNKNKDICITYDTRTQFIELHYWLWSWNIKASNLTYVKSRIIKYCKSYSISYKRLIKELVQVLKEWNI